MPDTSLENPGEKRGFWVHVTQKASYNEIVLPEFVILDSTSGARTWRASLGSDFSPEKL